MILLDTDICVEILRGNKKVVERRLGCEEETAISFLTVGELFYGSYKFNQPEKNVSIINRFLLSIQVIQSDYPIMRRFGEIKAHLVGSRQILPDADILVAATGLVKCTRLITGNLRHFQRIAGLTVENWIK
jgi:predicted nucleic acid-binding protein